jgi:hypothetical protein
VKQFFPDRILPRLLAVITAALLLLAVGVIAACGGDSSGADVDSVLNQTFGGKKKISSGRLDMTLVADLQGASTPKEPVKVKLGGPFESRGEKQVPKLDLQLSATAAGQTINAGVISTGTKGYINFQGTDYQVPTKTFDQFKTELKRQDGNQNSIPALSDLGVDPRKWLEDPKNEGTEKVGGVDATHISSGVNVAKLVDDLDKLLGKTGQLGLSPQQRQQLPQSLPENVKSQIRDSVKDAKLDVWTGKEDKILRKLRVKLDFAVAKNLQTQTSGISAGKIDFTVETSEVNKPQQIEEPKSARPLSELRGQLSALGALSGGTGSSGSGSSGSGSGSSGESPKTRRYLQCVQSAQGVKQIDECSALLK